MDNNDYHKESIFRRKARNKPGFELTKPSTGEELHHKLQDTQSANRQLTTKDNTKSTTKR
jgi:hypothetical protein